MRRIGHALVEACEHEANRRSDEEIDRARCEDCGRAITYDEARHAYRHVENPERGCFLIAAETSEKSEL